MQAIFLDTFPPGTYKPGLPHLSSIADLALTVPFLACFQIQLYVVESACGYYDWKEVVNRGTKP